MRALARRKWPMPLGRRDATNRVKYVSANTSSAVIAMATPAKTAGATIRQKNAPNATSRNGGCSASQLKKSLGLSTRLVQQDAFYATRGSARA